MAIRPELRQYYRADWHAFRLELIAERGRICGKCGREHPRINGAHMDHNPQNRASVELRCPSCHARHDAPHRIAIARRRRARETGQLWLTPEIEWAPFAGFEIPGAIFDRLAQLPLFR